MLMPLYVPATWPAGLPDKSPVCSSSDAHDGLLVIVNLRRLPRESLAVGVNDDIEDFVKHEARKILGVDDPFEGDGFESGAAVLTHFA
jgi:hypothetical protein